MDYTSTLLKTNMSKHRKQTTQHNISQTQKPKFSVLKHGSELHQLSKFTASEDECGSDTFSHQCWVPSTDKPLNPCYWIKQRMPCEWIIPVMHVHNTCTAISRAVISTTEKNRTVIIAGFYYRRITLSNVQFVSHAADDKLKRRV